MKKIFLPFAASLLLLTGCNSKTQDNAQKAEDTATVQVADVEIKELDDAQFTELVGSPEADGKTWKFVSDQPILVDFYATWCGPCRKMSPNVEKIANVYADKITVYKVDVDKANKTAGMFGISSIPTLMFVNPKTKQISGTSGYQEYDELEASVKEHFGF